MSLECPLPMFRYLPKFLRAPSRSRHRVPLLKVSARQARFPKPVHQTRTRAHAGAVLVRQSGAMRFDSQRKLPQSQ